jgi:ribosomal protein RSM22 (predicted rRNA methylase)
MELTSADWERLRELRDDFLEAGSRERAVLLRDYWASRRDLELYDCTFGARIGWKWCAVLGEIRLRGLEPPPGTLLDWGCGTGIASRAYASAFGAARITRLALRDRSEAAESFARERVQADHPAIEVEDERASRAKEIGADVLLVSHVLAELDERGENELLAIARASRWVVWVEPGTHAVSRRLSALRDRLRDAFEPLAPCTHDAACGMLAAGREKDWCHHFARAPQEAHRSRHWSMFARELGVDLRALPYSFLVLARRGERARADRNGTSRILGRPRIEKARARIDACDREGVHAWTLLEREDKALFKMLGDSAGECLLFDWRIEGERIREPRRAIGVEQDEERASPPPESAP